VVSREARNPRSGVTLVEMMVVVALIAVLAGVSFPAITAGLDSIRLASAADSLVSFLNAALNRAERRQQAVEVSISIPERTLRMRSTEPRVSRTLELPDGVSIVAVLPEPPQPQEGPRRFLLYPGGTVPRIGVEIAGQKGGRRRVQVDPITGIPRVERVEAR
jgi:prepilin-type N-terminal cleavage/methylation domain-containing protein